MPDTLTTICAWCGRTLDSPGASEAEGDPGPEAPGSESEAHRFGTVSHGICPDCVRALEIEPVANLHELTRDEYDRLPFGVIRVDAEGTVTSYNSWEEELTTFSRERVVGLNFFRDVAPCTAVQEFEGRFREMVGRGRPDRKELSFVFTLAGGDRRVHIILVWHPAFDEGLILVRDEVREEDREEDRGEAGDRGTDQRPFRDEGTGPT